MRTVGDYVPLVVERSDDGLYTVQEWFERIAISAPLLALSAPEIETVITFRFANGTRRYKIDGETESGRVLFATALEDV